MFKRLRLAGSAEKCNWLKDELNFDVAIDYKTKNIDDALREATPNGIDVYFDNVGGELSAIVMAQMNEFGRVAVCGSISTYNLKTTKSEMKFYLKFLNFPKKIQ